MAPRIALTLAFAVAQAAPCLADGPYLALDVGPAFLPDSDLSSSSASGELTYDPGFHVGGAIGMRAAEWLRAEVALGFRRAETDELEASGGSTRASGDVGVFASMANGYLDLAFLDLPVTPYVGAGLGVGVLLADFKVQGARVEDTDTQFAWNALGGLSYEGAGFVLTAGYRYLALTEAEIEGVDADFDVHELMLGIRREF